MPFFHSLFDPAFFFSASVALSAFSSYMSPSCGAEMGPRPSPGGQKRREIPRTTGLVTDSSGPSSHPYSTLYFPGKHLLSSLAQKLASNLPPHSCLVMPITESTQPCALEMEKKEGREGTLGEKDGE